MVSTDLFHGSSVTLKSSWSDKDCELLLQWRIQLAMVPGFTASGARQGLTLADIKAYVQRPNVNIFLIQINDGNVIGFIDSRELAYSGSVEIGCMISEDSLHGAGYAMEALMLIMDYQFHEMNAHRIQFFTAAFNKPVVSMLCSGFVHVDGVMRDYYFLDGTYHDAVVASILRDEYYSLLDSVRMTPANLVPREDKEQARELLAKYLSDNPITVS
jgi:RimJ/RimL family protein N-acetyltransferase